MTLRAQTDVRLDLRSWTDQTVGGVKGELKEEIAGVCDDLEAFQRNMMAGFIALLVTIIGAIVTHAL